jgi:hypothetical protein
VRDTSRAAHLGDVDAEAPVVSGASHTDEHARVDGGPCGTPSRAAAGAVGAGAVARLIQQRPQRRQLLLVLLHRHSLHLPGTPAPAHKSTSKSPEEYRTHVIRHGANFSNDSVSDVDLESPNVPLPELGFWQVAVRVVKMHR